MNEVAEMFEGIDPKIKRVNKKLYRQYLDMYIESYGEYLRALLDQINTVDDKDSMALIEARNFTNEAFEVLQKNGKVKLAKKVDASIYIIYYLFPAILETKHENASLLCDKIRDEWNTKFDQKINYADAQTITDGFRDKLFGIF